MAGRFERRSRTPAPSESTEMTKLKCLNDQVELIVHTRMLAHHSRRFRYELNSRATGRHTHPIRIPGNILSSTVQLFVDWVYMRGIGRMVGFYDKFTMKHNSYDFFKGWVFGNYLKAPSFQNDMVRYIIRDRSGYRFVHNMTLHLSDIPLGSALETLVLDLVCQNLLSLEHDKMMSELNRLDSVIIQKAMHLLLQNMNRRNMEESKSLTRGNNVFSWKIGGIDQYTVEEEEYKEESE
ncbi:hypothetical protein F5Y10DRAFT_293465 [Nemania abortiva]|nr:hypothetical protein F5Y10DRAFT_293465 [Nemania abortiva]